jgi:hypothetical protein
MVSIPTVQETDPWNSVTAFLTDLSWSGAIPTVQEDVACQFSAPMTSFLTKFWVTFERFERRGTYLLMERAPHGSPRF